MAKKEFKVGLLTWHFFSNVGSNLQAYSVYRTITALGFKCKFINYRGIWRESFFKKISKEILSRLNQLFPNRIPQRWRMETYRFQQDYMKQTKSCCSKEKLKRYNKKYSAFLCGSDQIWAPNVLDDVYLCSFVDDETPKLSYAASIGLPEIPKEKEGLYKNYLDRFDYITVREAQGAELLSGLLGKEIPWVLDPTFLVEREHWETIAIDPDESNYLFCYLLGNNPHHQKWIDDIAKEKNLTVICLTNLSLGKTYNWKYISNIGPREFLGYIKNSSLVITDSFHGMALSINLEKEFYILERFSQDDKSNQNSRIYNILDLCHLQDRVLKNSHTDGTPIDYGSVKKFLDVKKDYSINILKDMLEKAKRRT